MFLCLRATTTGRRCTNFVLFVLTGIFFTFSGIGLVGVVFCICVVPETRGKTPEDMKAYFMERRRWRKRQPTGDVIFTAESRDNTVTTLN